MVKFEQIFFPFDSKNTTQDSKNLGTAEGEKPDKGQAEESQGKPARCSLCPAATQQYLSSLNLYKNIFQQNTLGYQEMLAPRPSEPFFHKLGQTQTECFL